MIKILNLATVLLLSNMLVTETYANEDLAPRSLYIEPSPHEPVTIGGIQPEESKYDNSPGSLKIYRSTTQLPGNINWLLHVHSNSQTHRTTCSLDDNFIDEAKQKQLLHQFETRASGILFFDNLENESKAALPPPCIQHEIKNLTHNKGLPQIEVILGNLLEATPTKSTVWCSSRNETELSGEELTCVVIITYKAANGDETELIATGSTKK